MPFITPATPRATAGIPGRKHYARSFGKAQRDEARDRMLAHRFGALTQEPVGEDEADAAERETAALQAVSGVGGTGLEPVTPSLSSWCSPN